MLGFARKALMNGGDCPSYERLPDWNDDSDYSKGREWQ